MEKISLRAMTVTEFGPFAQQSKKNYGAQIEKSGHSREAAAVMAEKSFSTLLPNGLESSGQFIYTIVNASADSVIGSLWWGIKKEGLVEDAWVYDIELISAARGKGYGRMVMLAAQNLVKEKGFRRLGLHVFGHNEVARGLYDSLGYTATNVTMYKNL